MHNSDLIVIEALNHLVAQADQFVFELRTYRVTPASALHAAEEVAADFHRKRRTMLDEMMGHTMGEC